MHACRLLTTLIGLSMLCVSAQAERLYHFDDDFSGAERARLVAWIDEAAGGLEALVGPFPMDVHVHFQRTHAREPVPWANTLRGRRQGVRFRVDTSFSQEDFRRDWTAAHELSHLVLPYLGRRHAWFAEGFASYMQYQVMQAAGILTEAEARSAYRRKIERARRNYPYGRREFVAATPRLRAERKYPVMYWGGAVYFMRLNETMRHQSGQSIFDPLSQYMRCCRSNRGRLETLIADLDRLHPEELFSESLSAFRRERGFPEVDLSALALSPTL